MQVMIAVQEARLFIGKSRGCWGRRDEEGLGYFFLVSTRFAGLHMDRCGNLTRNNV
jgi:hypothetical protein